MNKISKFLPYLFIHLLLGFIACVIMAFWYPLKDQLLPPFLLAWRFHLAILFFIFYFPVIFISSIILAYTIIFGKYGPISISRGSSLMMGFIRSIFIIIISVVVVFVALCEFVRPIIIEKQDQALQKTFSYNEYKKLAKEAYERKDFAKAMDHINRAVSVWPQGKDALKFSEEVKISFEKFSLDNNFEDTVSKDSFDFSLNYTAEQALKTAQKAMVHLDFYTAHYYAKLAFKTFNDKEPLKQEAEALAIRAWKEIEKGLAEYLEKPEIIRFQRKRIAYEALQAGNFIKAYYDFLELHKELLSLDPDKKDPELERFLYLSRLNLLKNSFFIDELDNIPNFKVNKNIIFAGNLKENIYINIYGLSRSVSEAGQEIYLMNTVLTKKLGDKIQWSIFIPYSKIIEDDKNQLILQIKAVDRNNKINSLSPKLLTGDFPIDTMYNIPLSLNITNFNLIEEASLGPSKMKLSSLYYFIGISEDYGFKKTPYLREIIYRLSEPLLLFIVSILAVILSWRFRLTPGKRFKKRYFIFLPLCPFLAYVLIETIRFLCRLLISYFVILTPNFAPFIVLGFLILSFCIITVLLFLQRAE